MPVPSESCMSMTRRLNLRPLANCNASATVPAVSTTWSNSCREPAIRKDVDFADVRLLHFHWSSMLFGSATRECFLNDDRNRNFRLSDADSLVYAPLRKAWNEAARADQHEQPISRRLQFSPATFSRAIGCRCCHRHSPGDSDLDSVLHGAG